MKSYEPVRIPSLSSLLNPIRLLHLLRRQQTSELENLQAPPAPNDVTAARRADGFRGERMSEGSWMRDSREQTECKITKSETSASSIPISLPY